MGGHALRTLIIDNYDSFTFNLYQLVGTVNGKEPIVVRNDEHPWEALDRYDFDNIIISPGPGRPENPADFGISRQAILQAQVPVLGICLGHQGIGWLYGAKVEHAPMPMHGRKSAVYHDGSPLFSRIPQGFQVVRYHSLALAPALPDCLLRSAFTADGILMGIAHATLPRFGVQFHPESICTEYGVQLLTNFRDLSHRAGRGPRSGEPGRALSVVPQAQRQRQVSPLPMEVYSRKLSLPCPDAERIFASLYRQETLAFWLDSSRAETGLSRFSFMGAGTGPHGALLTYDLKTQEVTRIDGEGRQTFKESIYTCLERELERRRCQSDELPFDFNCGFVGYFGYELKAESFPKVSHPHAGDCPDAMFLLADRVIAIDHAEAAVYLLCLVPKGDSASAQAWFDATEVRLSALPPVPPAAPALAPVSLRLKRNRSRYLLDIARCKSYLDDGESYEICLTNQIHLDPITDPFALYLNLRRMSPAPYAAFLRYGDLFVLSSSPERFLRIDRKRAIESKPIKGTRPRGRTSAEDEALRLDLGENEKDRSENLMIVDLLRNDLGCVCELGSVVVPKLMQVESYATVFQLVSTVCGQMRRDVSALDCIRAAFPGGSMTGAPKLRTLCIIDQLEKEPRGIYSGALGYLALNGTVDLSIVIRTLVCTPTAATLGIGGAIVALSDPEAEFEETLVKARAIIDSLIVSSKGNRDLELREQVIQALREQGHASI